MAFEGKVVLITGASSGIGASTAIHFASLGADLALHGRNVENLKKVSNDCTNASSSRTPKLLLIPGEITSEDVTENILEKTIKHFGKLDILINNAGVLKTGSIESTSLEQYDDVMNVNMRSVYQLTMLAVPHLIKTKDNIVNVSSICGLRSYKGVLAYCISKAALDQFTRCVALDLAPKQVRVNSVNPGVIVTNLHTRGAMNPEQYEQFIKKGNESHPLGRNGDPEEVARSIAFLASNGASFITGVTLAVDGGRQALSQ